MKRLSASILGVLAALSLAACGSSRAPGVVLAPSSGPTGTTVTPAPSTTSSTSTTAAAPVATPTSGPLAKEPAIAKPAGPAPGALVKKDLIVGTGATAGPTSSVVVNYVGALYSNGKVFDASWKRNQTFPVQLGQGQVIKGWDQGIPGMKVGGRRELIIPASLAYGAQGSPPTIPANATLIFVVDLLKVQ